MEELTLRAGITKIQDTDAQKDIELATLTAYDIPALAVLSVVAYGEQPAMESLLDAGDQIRMIFEGAFGELLDDSLIGAWLEGELIGAIFGVLDPPWEDALREPYVLDLMVAPEYRRNGIASALISELAKRVQTWGYDSLTLNLDLKKMPEAFRVYSQLGFERV